MRTMKVKKMVLCKIVCFGVHKECVDAMVKGVVVKFYTNEPFQEVNSLINNRPNALTDMKIIPPPPTKQSAL